MHMLYKAADQISIHVKTGVGVHMLPDAAGGYSFQSIRCLFRCIDGKQQDHSAQNGYYSFHNRFSMCLFQNGIKIIHMHPPFPAGLEHL